MSILIKGMEMPDCGYVCLKVFANGDVMMNKVHRGALVITGIKDKVGTAVPVPPHGDLIERDAAYDKIAEQEGGNYVDMDAVGMGLSETPVVIPAEEET
jgi:hypothetical protein